MSGAGVGGEYPLAATVTSESSSAASRGKLMSAVFAMQGVSKGKAVSIAQNCTLTSPLIFIADVLFYLIVSH